MKTSGPQSDSARVRPRSGWADLGTWLLALVGAVGLWLFVNVGERESERTVRARVDLAGLPAGMMITEPVPEYVEVRVSGSGLILSTLDAQRLRVSLDLSGAKEGVENYRITAQAFELPRSVEVTRIRPARVSVWLDRVIRKVVPVRLDARGELGRGLLLASGTVQPDEVRISGPAKQIGSVREIATEIVDREGLGAGVTEVDVDLVAPAGLVRLEKGTARVRFVVEPDVAERSFAAARVQVVGSTVEWEVSPATVDLEVRGLRPDVEALAIGTGEVSVDASELSIPGPHDVAPLVSLPPGVEVVSLRPATVRLELRPQATDTPDEEQTGSN